jgi:TPR repeat protein
LNALGWYALERERNSSKALEYFERSYKRGNPDAAHNIGHMMRYGRMPDGKVDKVCTKIYNKFFAILFAYDILS